MGTATENKPLPGKPDPATLSGVYWTLTYRNGKRAQDYDFEHEGTHEEAISLGREYCKLRKLSFLNVSPYFEKIREANDYYVQQQAAESPSERKPGVVY